MAWNPGTMTPKRRRVFDEFREALARGEHVSVAELARRTGCYDFRDCRRTIRDLRRMGKLPEECAQGGAVVRKGRFLGRVLGVG